MFPKKATASVTGIGGMAGGVGGIVLTWAVQKNLFVHFREIGEIEKAYFIMFLICGGSYLLAWLVLHFLAPKMDRVRI
jgi:ACS family hexuronate transporter-like MFS transporter